MVTPPFLPYGRHSIDDDDIAAVTAVLRSDFLTTGPLTPKFDQALAQRVGSQFAVGCANGTAALHLAAASLGWGPGDWVIVPAVTFLATANAARYVGADVLFTDVDPQSGLMRPQDLEQALAAAKGKRVRAVLPVHLGGQACDMPAIAKIARAHGLAVVEDACHALGTTYGGDENWSVGSCRHSDMAVFSFHPVKTIAMGEGGAITTNDPDRARALTLLRSHAMVREPESFVQTDMAFDANGSANPWYYEMAELGFNFRLSEIACALGLSQLAKLDRIVERRQALVARYDGLLEKLAHSQPVTRVPGCRPGWHLYAVRMDFQAIGKNRAQVMTELRAQGIGTQVHYIPVSSQPYYRQLYGEASLPGAEAYYQSCLSLPLFFGMEDGDVDRVVTALDRVCTR